MDINECISKMKAIQKALLTFLRKEEFYKQDRQTFMDFFDEQNIKKYCFKEFLYLLANISKNHKRNSTFNSKIVSILLLLKDDIQQRITNHDLFNIFFYSHRIILSLIQRKMLIIDDYICSSLQRILLAKYFAPEMISYITKEPTEIKKSFDEKRKEGENDEIICQLIRKDSIDEFISYVDQNNIDLKKEFDYFSTFETNYFLISAENLDIFESLIYYAAFYGSIQIVKYLKKKKVGFHLRSLLLAAIHSGNLDLIHILDTDSDDNKIYLDCYIESIKCYDKKMANYFKQKCNQRSLINEADLLKYYNYDFFPNNFDNTTIFSALCRYDYPFFVKFMMKNYEININGDKIFKKFVNGVFISNYKIKFH